MFVCLQIGMNQWHSAWDLSDHREPFMEHPNNYTPYIAYNQPFLCEQSGVCGLFKVTYRRMETNLWIFLFLFVFEYVCRGCIRQASFSCHTWGGERHDLFPIYVALIHVCLITHLNVSLMWNVFLLYTYKLLDHIIDNRWKNPDVAHGVWLELLSETNTTLYHQAMLLQCITLITRFRLKLSTFLPYTLQDCKIICDYLHDL